MSRAAGGKKLVPSAPPAGELATIIERAKARADADAVKAMADARAALPTLPEYFATNGADGRTRNVIPVAAMARGMLAYLEEAYERNHRAQAVEGDTALSD